MPADHSAQLSSPYQFSFSAGMIIFFTFPWINQLLNAWGYRPYRGAGFWISIALALLIFGLAIGLDYLLFRLGLTRATRSGLWFAATFGPLAGFAVINTWESVVAGQISAVLATLLGFVVGYWLPDAGKKRGVFNAAGRSG